MNTWLQYIPDEELEQSVRDIEFTEDMTVEEILEQKLVFDQALIDFLEHNIRSTSTPHVADFFQTLRNYVVSQTAQTVWSTREERADSELPQVH
ncbi:MAG: hypothetical protein R3C11_11520 [Planctomycetaceae bacterium]